MFDQFETLIKYAFEKMSEREHPIQIIEKVQFPTAAQPTRVNPQIRSKSVDSSKTPSKRSRIWNFFRGRTRATEQETMIVHTDQSSSPITLIDHQSTK